MGIEPLLIILLVLANGLFSMAEMAVVSARKARLRQRSDDGSKGAAVALRLAENPHDFLSTVQVGITMIGTLAGAFGGAAIADDFASWLKQFPPLAQYSQTIAMTVVVLAISYLSLILGELVPKSIALSNAEGIASALAPLMNWLSRIGSPAVKFLTLSTRLVMFVVPVRTNSEAPVTEDEVKVLIAQGTEHGTFLQAEQEMVEGVFRLGDRRAIELIQPRNKVAVLDVTEPWEVNREIVRTRGHSIFPVVEGDLDHMIGILHIRDLLDDFEAGKSPDLRALSRRALFVPENTTALDLLERLEKSGDRMAFLVDEHGGVHGLVTLTDLMQSITADLRGPGESGRGRIVQHADGSWLVDGGVPVSDLREELKVREFPNQDEGFTTAAGLVLASLNRIPKNGDFFKGGGFRFEVVRMDGNRIDKIAISRSR
jgi:putative hemolysin